MSQLYHGGLQKHKRDESDHNLCHNKRSEYFWKDISFSDFQKNIMGYSDFIDFKLNLQHSKVCRNVEVRILSKVTVCSPHLSLVRSVV